MLFDDDDGDGSPNRLSSGCGESAAAPKREQEEASHERSVNQRNAIRRCLWQRIEAQPSQDHKGQAHRCAKNGNEHQRPSNGEVEGPRAGAGWSRECTLSSPTRGETTDSHGPLQRLLAAAVPSVPCMIDLCA